MLAHKLKAPGEGSLLTPMIFVKALDIQSMCFKFRLSTQIDQVEKTSVLFPPYIL